MSRPLVRTALIAIATLSAGCGLREREGPPAIEPGKPIAESARNPKIPVEVSYPIIEDNAVGAAQRPRAGNHSIVVLDDTNFGRKGELGVHATFVIENPNPVELTKVGHPEQITYNIVLSVRDLTGTLVMGDHKIGEATDVLGKGNWTKDFEVTVPMFPGEYLVRVEAQHPTMMRKADNGEGLVPYGAGGSQRVITVQ
jgi:hypothetical protein